jgi:hypothetical protein
MFLQLLSDCSAKDVQLMFANFILPLKLQLSKEIAQNQVDSSLDGAVQTVANLYIL